MADTGIQTVHAREILDSRGNPTVEVDEEQLGDRARYAGLSAFKP